MKPRLQKHYEERVRPRLMEEFGYANPYQVPRIEKIVVNVGLGEAPRNPKRLDSGVGGVALITGPRPVGVKVTLRRARMYEFLDRLINVAIPRIRDFRGVPTRSFDGRGNYTLGIKEQLIFPEIDYDKVEKIHGMDIVITTSARRDDEAMALLREMGMPFRGQQPVLVTEAA